MFFAYLASALAIMLVLIFVFKVEERFSVTGLATLALAIATIFLAWDAHQQLPILSGQLDEMKKVYDLTTKAVGVADKTANAAIEANNLTRQTFVAGQRSWVIYDYLATKITSPLILDTQSGGRMELEFSVRTTGQTIARNTAVYAAISFLRSKHADKVAEQKAYCDMMRFFTTPFNAMTISPDKTFSPYPTTIALVNREALSEAVEYSKRVIPFIIGCIDYQSVFDTSHHQTPFIFDLGTLSQPNSMVLEPIDIAQSPISIDRLRLRKFTFGGENPD
jgi:hypothetical protein